MKIVDRLKSALLGEMASAEWELLEKEWDDEIQEQPLGLKDAPVQNTLEPDARGRSTEENDTTSIETAEPTRPDMADTEIQRQIPTSQTLYSPTALAAGQSSRVGRG